MILIVALIAAQVATSSASPPCTPHACLIYREAAVLFRADAKRAHAELEHCAREKSAIETEHEKALKEFVADASATPPSEESLGLPLIITIVLASIAGAAGFAGGVVLGIKAR